jgi:hypothetical protein
VTWNTRVLYYTFDITSALNADGANAIGVLLGEILDFPFPLLSLKW